MTNNRRIPLYRHFSKSLKKRELAHIIQIYTREFTRCDCMVIHVREWGSRGPEFESRHSDHEKFWNRTVSGLFFFGQKYRAVILAPVRFQHLPSLSVRPKPPPWPFFSSRPGVRRDSRWPFHRCERRFYRVVCRFRLESAALRLPDFPHLFNRPCENRGAVFCAPAIGRGACRQQWRRGVHKMVAIRWFIMYYS